MKNKETAINFLRESAAGKVYGAFEKYISPTFTHHNPYFRGDRESLLTAIVENYIKKQKHHGGKVRV